MNNIFFNASHTDSAPANTFGRPKHDFKGIGHDEASTEDKLEEATDAPRELEGSNKIAHLLPQPRALHENTPNHARHLMGLPTLPASLIGAPRPLHDVHTEREAERLGTGPEQASPKKAD